MVIGSIAQAGGEITFLAMSSHYNKNTISSWSSGTGAAGLFGALSYLALKGWIGLTQQWALTVVTPLPLITLFW